MKTNGRQYAAHDEDRLRAMLAQCWTAQALLMLAALMLAFLQAAVMDDFSNFLFDPGHGGWLALCVILTVAGMMPLMVTVQRARWFRLLNLVLILSSALLPVLHHGRHYMEGRLPDAGATPEAFALGVGVFGLVLALRWLRMDSRAPTAGARGAAS